MLCRDCQEPITGRYVNWGRNAYHPEHFVCAHCSRPIRGPFAQRDGHPYHPSCHEALFAERCGLCSQPLSGKYVTDPEGSYHAACFQNLKAPRCAVCGVGMLGSQLVDPWGNAYHPQHRKEAPLCTYCGRVISARTTGGGMAYSDGRSICRMCHSSVIGNEHTARPLVQRVRARMAQWGLDVPEVPWSLVDRNALRRLLRQSGHPASETVNGFTRVEILRRGREVVNRQTTVYLLHGMPREHFEGTTAHELMHVWISQNASKRLHPSLEEGACNYLKYLIHQQSSGEDADQVIKGMMADPHEYYGHGFRRAKAYVDRNGFEALLTLLQRGSHFPLGY